MVGVKVLAGREVALEPSAGKVYGQLSPFQASQDKSVK